MQLLSIVTAATELGTLQDIRVYLWMESTSPNRILDFPLVRLRNVKGFEK